MPYYDMDKKLGLVWVPEWVPEGQECFIEQCSQCDKELDTRSESWHSDTGLCHSCWDNWEPPEPDYSATSWREEQELAHRAKYGVGGTHR